MERLSATLQLSLRHHAAVLNLPDVEEYGHPRLVEAYRRLVEAHTDAKEAADTLHGIEAAARRLQSHDAEQHASAQADVADTSRRLDKEWAAFAAALADPGITAHHAGQQREAAQRVRELTGELREAIVDYIAHAALSLGRQHVRASDVPALQALDHAFHGEGIGSKVGLVAALDALN
ncbi:hypothetical protein [Acrocarpospora phusangensis]|nr:hypothetical protein [Acrocarpospora phusangensis]